MSSLEKRNGGVFASMEGQSAVSVYMSGVYRWMTGGLALTGIVAWMVASSPAAIETIFGSAWIAIGLMIAQLALVVVLSAAIHKMSPMTATLCFLGYSALTGLTFSSIFVAYSMDSIARAFFATAGAFAALSIYGSVTKRDLSGVGSFCMMGLFGILIAIIVNLFLKSTMMDFVISCAGVLVFSGLTAWDTQKLRAFGADSPLDDSVAMHRGIIIGALTLYLDFINLFLMLLRLFGGGRD